MENDLRVYKTKREICKAFIILLSKKSFHNITIQDLSKVSGYSRSTIYRNYTNTWEIYKEIAEAYARDMCKCWEVDYEENEKKERSLQIMVLFMKVIRSWYPLGKAMLKDNSNFLRISLRDEFYERKKHDEMFLPTAALQYLRDEITEEVVLRFSIGTTVDIIEIATKHIERTTTDQEIQQLAEKLCDANEKWRECTQ